MCSSVLDRVESTTLRVSRMASRTLSISVLPSCADLWLLPLLTQFNKLNPDIRLQVSTSQAPVQFKLDGPDLALRLGRLPGVSDDGSGAPFVAGMVKDWSGVKALHLWDEHVSPVCSVRLLNGTRGIEKIADLKRHTLIHNASRPDLWPMWLESQGADMSVARSEHWVGQRFMAVNSAREDMGVACVAVADIELLDWRRELAFPFPQRITTGEAYYLLHKSDSLRIREIEIFAEWLRSLNRAPHPLTGQ